MLAVRALDVFVTVWSPCLAVKVPRDLVMLKDRSRQERFRMHLENSQSLPLSEFLWPLSRETCTSQVAAALLPRRKHISQLFET